MTSPQQNGLVGWRKRQAEAREEKLAELEGYRANATTEIVDGREFRVVRIPDAYDASWAMDVRPRVEPRRKNRRAAA